MSVRVFAIVGVLAIAELMAARPGMADESPEARLDRWRDGSTAVSGIAARSLIKQQFIDFDPRYAAQKRQYEPEVTEAAREIAALEWKGRTVPCSKQIYLEAKWLLNYTAFFGELAELLQLFKESLKVEDQSFADEQSPSDGGWGACYRRMFKRLDATVGALEELHSREEGPQYALRLYPNIKSLSDFEHALEELILSDIDKSGENDRAALNSVITSLGRLHLKQYWRPYVEGRVKAHFHDRLAGRVSEIEQELGDFLDDWQDPETGFWGAWYRDGERIYRTSDLSITFHIVSYRKGKVARTVAIARHLLDAKYEEYPYGWFKDGRMSNHNNYDVVKILRLIWRDVPDELQDRFEVEIENMTRWALGSSLQPDGSVAFYDKMFESASAEYYYLVSFLEEVGYWQKDRPFWIDGDIAEVPYGDHALSTCLRIKRSFDSRRFQDGPSLATRQKLERACPDKH